MQLTRTTKFAAVAATGVLALAACSNSNSGGSSSPVKSTAASGVTCVEGTINAEGSSAQNNAMTEWIKGYQTDCPNSTINYNPTGSGAGISQFNAGQVDFAGSDSPLNPDKGEVDAAKQRCGADAWNLPMVVGPISVAYNVEGLDSLVLNADTIAEIFKGQIKTWNDPKIAKLNPGAKLPNAPITVFYRSDESGTTENFTKYLSATAPKVWTDAPAKAWTGTGEGKEKSSGVQQATIQTPNSITYVEWSYARDGNLGMAQIDTGAAKPVTLNAETAGAALSAAKVTGKGNDLVLSLDYTTSAANTYPIVLVTYEIACSNGVPSPQGDLVKAFLTYTASKTGQSKLAELGYGPLPAQLQQKVSGAVAALKP